MEESIFQRVSRNRLWSLGVRWQMDGTSPQCGLSGLAPALQLTSPPPRGGEKGVDTRKTPSMVC